VETAEVLRLMQDVAAEVITPRFQSLRAGQIHEKNPGDLVTVADHEAEQLITDALVTAYPDAVVLGEEAAGVDASLHDRFAAAAHAFTVDPLDGTKNFVHGSPDHAVMVAEIVDGVVHRSWIWQPQHLTSYVAERGHGAFRDGMQLFRPAPSPVAKEWRGVTSRRAWIGRELPGMRPLELTWVCCGVDYPQLVRGYADVILYGRAQPWDHAPGSLLLAEAGGYVGTTDGHDYDPRTRPSGLVVASRRQVYDVVTQLLADARYESV
jgi:fructose-1,6-bisphosphatase/inositol monophosphatase family enzyme